MSIITKTIGDLKDHRFFVPSYQRGYRWTKHEVTALLNDIFEFSTEGGKRYCIQPLIVKRRLDGSFEVVDGQQRLTTIYIFMKIAEEKTEYHPFDIEFETRKSSQVFLSNLSPKGEIDFSTIDDFHITTARDTINTWLDGHKIRYIAINDIFKRFIESVYFIWYEIPLESDPIVKKSTVAKNDWRYCFIKHPGIFTKMSASHLRLREVSGEMVVIPNKSSNGYNYDVFLLALYKVLKQNGIESYFGGELGTWSDRFLSVKGFFVRFRKGKFILKDETNVVVFETVSDDPISEVEKYLC